MSYRNIATNSQGKYYYRQVQEKDIVMPDQGKNDNIITRYLYKQFHLRTGGRQGDGNVVLRDERPHILRGERGV